MKRSTSLQFHVLPKRHQKYTSNYLRLSFQLLAGRAGHVTFLFTNYIAVALLEYAS